MDPTSISKIIKNTFENVISIPLILNQIFIFINNEEIKSLALCNKKMYQSYCKQIKCLKINQSAEMKNFVEFLYKYNNVNNLDLNNCRYIEDFTLISKFERLEILNVGETRISDISFLEENKNIKELSLYDCKRINDFKSISKLENIKILDIGKTNIFDISFLEKNKNIKELKLFECREIKDFTPISKLEKLEILNVGGTYISDISFLEKIKILKN